MEFNTIITIYICFAAFFYFLVHIGLWLGLKRIPIGTNSELPFISIIVAARNEEKNIRQLLNNLTQQTYPSYEIIIVNDRSSDSTSSLIAEFQSQHSSINRIDITTLQDDMPAKKNALRVGIEASKGEILCFTDADCSPPTTWLSELIQQFTPEVGLVAGFSPYRSGISRKKHANFVSRIFYDFISYEEFRAAVWSAGSIGWRFGWLCTGRNLAYRRKVYDEVGGFEKIKMSISGDDDLFLQLVRRITNWDIRYIYSQLSVVPTDPPSGFWQFVEQRKRHFSAAKYFTFPMMSFFFLYHSSNLLIFLSPILFILKVIPISILLLLIFLKFAGDSILIIPTSHILNEGKYHKGFILMEILYVFYNTLIGPLGFIRNFSWKPTSIQ